MGSSPVMVIPMTYSAPNFPNKSTDTYPYPEQTRLISQAWDLTWRLLGTLKAPIPYGSLVDVVAATHGAVSIATVKRVILEAIEEGVLYSEKVNTSGRTWLVSAHPFNVEENGIPMSYRPFRVALKDGGPMTKDDLRARLVNPEQFTEPRFRFAFTKLTATDTYVRPVSGDRWEWTGV